jgi:hypothetical protein
MKVIVIHDAKGNIRSFAVPDPRVPNDTLEPERGYLASEIDMPGVELQGEARERLRKLHEALKDRRVQRTGGQVTLVAVPPGKKPSGRKPPGKKAPGKKASGKKRPRSRR